MEHNVKKVAVIGAGASGLAAIKSLVAEKAFDTIKCYERGSKTAGIWNYSPTPEHSQVPSTDPHQELKSWRSPVYEELEANLVTDIMAYAQFPFPKSSPLFVDRTDIVRYLHEFGESVKDYIQFDTQVTRIEKIDGQWRVTTKRNGEEQLEPRPINGEQQTAESNEEPSEEEEEEFDAVVVATGNYNLPFLPDYPGIQQWSEKHPGTVIHSKGYRRGSDYKGQRVFLVGGSTSAYDLAAQLLGNAESVYQSIRSGGPKEVLAREGVNYVVGIDRFEPESRTVVLVDGTEVKDIDTIIFATGYLRNYPFLDHTVNKTDKPVVTHGRRMENLYQHLFYAPDPTLAFMVTPRQVMPFPTAEAQSVWVSRVWANRVQLPSYAERQKWEQDRLELKGDGPAFGSLGYPENTDYHVFILDQIAAGGGVEDIPVQPDSEDLRRQRRNGLALRVANDEYVEKYGKHPYSIDELIDAGLFEWKDEPGRGF